jgi:hypothetical protein
MNYCHTCGHWRYIIGVWCQSCLNSLTEQMGQHQYYDVPESWNESDANPEG